MKTFLTRHAVQRCAQRGVRPADLELALRVGTRTDDGVLVRRADVRSRVAELKQQIDRLERLAGLYVAYPDEAVVTAYRPSRRRERHILRDELRRDPRRGAA